MVYKPQNTSCILSHHPSLIDTLCTAPEAGLQTHPMLMWLHSGCHHCTLEHMGPDLLYLVERDSLFHSCFFFQSFSLNINK